MFKSCLLLVTIISSFQHAAQSGAPNPGCGDNASAKRRLGLSINSKTNGTGEWVTTFSALKNSSKLSNDINLDVSHETEEVQGYHIIHIHGVIKETSVDGYKQSLFFHKKSSKNAAITNNGRSVQKLSLEAYGVVITNRPLMDNELFEVRLDKKISKFNHAVGIGVTAHSPSSLDIPDHMFNVITGTRMLYHNHIYQNGTIVITNYQKMNLKDLPVGDRVGVLKSDFATLSFYLNGVDQGPAATNVHFPVYGVFELYGDALQGTIINP